MHSQSILQLFVMNTGESVIEYKLSEYKNGVRWLRFKAVGAIYLLFEGGWQLSGIAKAVISVFV
jgi:hypothetical protein